VYERGAKRGRGNLGWRDSRRRRDGGDKGFEVGRGTSGG